MQKELVTKLLVQVTIMASSLIFGGVASADPVWLELIPYGGIEIGGSEAWSREQLEKRFDEIAVAYTNEPFIVTKTKWMTTVFDHVQLGVNTNDLFVHWHPDSLIVGKRIQARKVDYLLTMQEVEKKPFPEAAWTWLDTSHTCPDWESVIALGPTGLRDRAKKRLETAKNDEERLFLSCIVEAYEGLIRELIRWADFAEAKGMREVAAVLRENAAHEPRTFREALQWSLVYDRAQEVEHEDVRSQGLFDRLFIKYYRDDLIAGRETRDSMKRLLADYYTRFWSQQHPNNKNIAFGGYDAKGEVVWNELTELGFEVFRELGRINPKLTFRFGKKTPKWQLETVCACLAEGKTSIVFACDETLYEAFRKYKGVEEADLKDYLLVGCYEPGICGREMVASMEAHFGIAKPMEYVFKKGAPKTYAEFERAYMQELHDYIQLAMDRGHDWARNWYNLNPSPIFSGGSRDAIEKARDVGSGGFKYNSSGIVMVGLGTVADSLAAIKYLVEEEKLVTMKELGEILDKNWEGYEELRLKARNAAPKWGNNDDRVDMIAKKIYDAITEQVNNEPNYHGGNCQAGVWSIYLDLIYGRQTGATADGRKKGETLNRNNSATAGCGKEGPTALMNSNLKFDLTKSPDGHIVDVILPASRMNTEAGAKYIASMLRTYFDRGGQCIHLNTFNSATLRDAMAHPEKYSDLQVRVCGWNVLWNDLSKEE